MSINAKNFRFIPGKDDKEWLKEALNEISDGGVLITDLAIYRKKEAENGDIFLCAERSIDTEFPSHAFDIIPIELEINKVKNIASEIGIIFKDLRILKLN